MGANRDHTLTPFQARILSRARETAHRYPTFTSTDVNEELGRRGEAHHRTSAVDVALTYLAAAGHLIRIRRSVYRLAVSVFAVPQGRSA